MHAHFPHTSVAQTIAKVPFTPGHEMVGEVSSECMVTAITYTYAHLVASDVLMHVCTRADWYSIVVSTVNKPIGFKKSCALILMDYDNVKDHLRHDWRMGY